MKNAKTLEIEDALYRLNKRIEKQIREGKTSEKTLKKNDAEITLLECALYEAQQEI